jgi:hypothetical protein
MKQLLIKEFKLTSCPLTFFFLAFSAMTMIPNYPILVCAFFMCLGIFYTFQFAREYNDVIYTALLPVAKRDVVRARFAFVITIQCIGFVLCTALTLVRMCRLSESQPYVSNPLMNANFVFLGGILLIFALFNLIFVAGFFKTAFYYGKPFYLFATAAFVVIGILEVLHHIPGLEGLNSCGFSAMGQQLAVLGIGLVAYAVATAAALAKSIRTFEQIDLSF